MEKMEKMKVVEMELIYRGTRPEMSSIERKKKEVKVGMNREYRRRWCHRG
jgi:hypothetical protein